MYVIPLKIIYQHGEYSDGVDITAQEVYRKLETEIPTTSLPSGDELRAIFEKIKVDGYEKVLAITISSGLSGTYNSIRLAGSQQKGLEVFVLDTKNIGIGSGFSAIQAAEYIQQGMPWDTLLQTLSENISKSKIFFCVSTLEYLRKGGRIGLVATLLGSALNLKPVISCNEDGVYYTAAKVRGRKKSFDKAIQLAVNFIGDAKNYNIAIVNGDAEQEANQIKEIMMPLLPNCNIYVDGQISPALGVHTGPGLIGIGVHII
ncbi:MAG: DegV family protein [Epulopiscium sp.]|nr:DegV family protein [Candidatus Epulonipiscium sp.]